MSTSPSSTGSNNRIRLSTRCLTATSLTSRSQRRCDRGAPPSSAPKHCLPTASRSFFGCLPGDLGFILEPQEALELLEGKPPEWRDVVRPYLIGNDLTKDPEQHPSRWAIDFGHRTLEQAMQFPEALEIVRAARQAGARQDPPACLPALLVALQGAATRDARRDRAALTLHRQPGPGEAHPVLMGRQGRLPEQPRHRVRVRRRLRDGHPERLRPHRVADGRLVNPRRSPALHAQHRLRHLPMASAALRQPARSRRASLPRCPWPCGARCAANTRSD